MSKPASLIILLALPLAGETVAIVNARIVPVTSAPIERGTIVIADGKISAMGAKAAIPAGARRIEGAGLTVHPGWIDAYSSAGLSEISSVKGSMDVTELGPFNPQSQAWIAVNPHSEMIRTARVNGVTSVLAAPAGNLISGTASAVNLQGKYPNEMVLRPRVGVVINVPSIDRPVERPAGPPGGGPPPLEERRRRVSEDTAKLKQFLREAKAYTEMRTRLEKAGGSFTAGRDAALEAMVPVMRGESAAICVADHFREIRAAVGLGDEFGMKVIIAGGAEAAKVAGLLKEKDVPVLYSAIYSLPRTASDPYDVNFATPEVLRRAGVRFAIVTASSADVRNLPYEAAHAAAYGLEKEDAVKAISLWPAEILGIAGKVGSLETGKLANLLVTRGDPLDVRSEVRYVFIEGKMIPLESRNSEQADKFAQ